MQNVISIINQLRATTKTNEKLKILTDNKDNELLKSILFYTYNPNLQYGFSESKLRELLHERNNSYSRGWITKWDNLFSMLKELSSSNINDSLRSNVTDFIAMSNIEQQELIINVLTKDLRANISEKTINKVWKDLIPLSQEGFPVKCMLASKFDINKIPNEKMYVTEKLDGIRCWAKFQNGNIKLYTRQGKTIEGCTQIESGIDSIARSNMINNFILDGEILATDCDYATVYKETTKRLKNKKEIKDGLYFNVFDIIDVSEAENGKGIDKYHIRRSRLDRIRDTEFVKILPLSYMGRDFDVVMSVLDTYREDGAEGLMINLDEPYEFKRSKNILKLKVMETCDVKCIGIYEGDKSNVGKLGGITFEFKHEDKLWTCNCGSGFSQRERELYFKQPELIVGKIVELQYFEITQNQQGGYGLRFPVWLNRIREDKTEISMN